MARAIEILRRCLRNDAQGRPRDIRDVRLELEEVASGGAKDGVGVEHRAAAASRNPFQRDAEILQLAGGLDIGGKKYSVEILDGDLPPRFGPCALFIDVFGRSLSPVSASRARLRV